MSGEDLTDGADDLTERYRAASARDAARPGEAVRQAILAHARSVANEAPRRSTWHVGLAASVIVGGLASLLAWHARPPAPAAVPSAPASARPAEPPAKGPAASVTPGAAFPRSRSAEPAPLPPGTTAAKEAGADMTAERARAAMAPPRANLEVAPAAAPPARANLEVAPAAAPSARVEARRSASSSALVAAAESGDLARVEQLLRGGTSTEQTDARGRTALLVATSRGDVPLVRLLLAAGARSDVVDADGDTPLAAAQRQGSPTLLRLLEEARP
ncbi:MAG TPA: ankyrin repeat domain-containing protein [Steroidobacteraceae bacterium]|nr:ankyrin repeat domain-containing protein [Steroidobacteraceae bacterium]